MNSLIKRLDSSIRDDTFCHICGAKKAKPLYTYLYNDKQSEILQCVECRHLFLYPPPLVELTERTMDSLSDAELFGNKLFKWLYEYCVIDREIRSVKKYLQEKNPKLLDIGCGTGWSTAIWQKNGFSVTGLEPSEARTKLAKEAYRINVVNRHIEDFTTEEKFDVVILRHLLEHIENPVAMLKKVSAFLKPRGFLVIVIPNINCIGRYVFHENWEWILPWHLHFYTPKTLTRLTTKMGFKILRLYQMPSPLWYPRALNRLLGNPQNKKNLINTFSSVCSIVIVGFGFLLNLNDNMTLIGEKQPKT